MPIVIDTSVALKWVLTELYVDRAEAPRDDLLRQKELLIAPSLLLYEASNVLYQYVYRDHDC
jgi:predicted nucleic acid-binding protein